MITLTKVTDPTEESQIISDLWIAEKENLELDIWQSGHYTPGELL